MEKPKLYHPLKIGSLSLRGNLLLAPLAGFTDKAFRSMALKEGADLCFTEMVSCEAIARDNAKTLPLMERADREELLGIQIFTGNLDSMERCLDKVALFKPSLLDLNCGCPVPKVVKTGAGSALMKTPDLLYQLVKAMKGTGFPVSVKIRSGWDFNSINYREIAQAIVEAGADLITMHPRTRSQGYSGHSNWDHLKDLKQRVPIPVLGSGDLFTPQDVEKMLIHTGIDGVMFARGSLGNPFLFSSTRHYLQKQTLAEPPSYEQRILYAREHFRLAVQYYGERKTCKEIRKHLCSYTKGMPGSSELRNRLIQCTNPEEYEMEFSAYLDRLNSPKT